MRTNGLRAFASIFALTLIVFSVSSATTTEQAQAAPESEQNSFIMVTFPHDSDTVSFYDSWGARRSGGRTHRGIDIISPRRTEVRAVAEGTVATFGEQRLSGYFIRIEHAGGWTSSYMHLNNDTPGTDDGEAGIYAAIHPSIVEGATVHAGQVIGYVGDSGNAEGTVPHTHFELSYAGEKINPYPYLLDVWEREQRGTTSELIPS
ncbi:MAG: M23 family metallopeptidase [Acidimicrobiia bacterium]